MYYRQVIQLQNPLQLAFVLLKFLLKLHYRSLSLVPVDAVANSRLDSCATDTCGCNDGAKLLHHSN